MYPIINNSLLIGKCHLLWCKDHVAWSSAVRRQYYVESGSGYYYDEG